MAAGVFFLFFFFFDRGRCGRAVSVWVDEKIRRVIGGRFVIVCSFIPFLLRGFGIKV